MDATQEKSSISLKRFCGPEDAGNNTDKPFVVGDFRYATNGHVVVRIPSGGEASTTLTGKVINGAPRLDWPKRAVAASRLIPWPPIDWFFEYEYDDGAWYPSRDEVQLGEQRISTKYHYLISLLPNVRYLPGEDLVPVYFCFDGGEGFVMPVRSLDQ